MKYILLALLFVWCEGCNSQTANPQSENHPMPNMGMKYVRQDHHIDSSFRYGDKYKWNNVKSYADSIEKELNRQSKLDSVEEIAYRQKNHFAGYYYMWNYTTQTSEGWGEDEIVLDHKPTHQEIKDYVWNTMFKGDKGRKYEVLEIVNVSRVGHGGMEGMSGRDKGMLNHQISMDKQIHQP